MAVTTEIAPNLYRISVFAPWGNLQFNHFLVKDEEPLLFQPACDECMKKFAKRSEGSLTLRN